MKCSECERQNAELAQIPYIDHRVCMLRAYDKRSKLIRWLVGTNLAWVGIVIALLLRG